MAFFHLMRNLNGSVKCLLHLTEFALGPNQNSLSVMSLKTSNLTPATRLFLMPTDLVFESSFRGRLHHETAASQATQVNRLPRSQTHASSPGLNTGIHKQLHVNTTRFLDTTLNWVTLKKTNNNTELSTCATHRSDGNTPQTPLSHADILSERTLLQLNFKKDPSLTA